MKNEKEDKILNELLRTFQVVGAVVAGIISWNLDHHIPALIIRTIFGWVWLIYAWFTGVIK